MDFFFLGFCDINKRKVEGKTKYKNISHLFIMDLTH